MGNSQGANPMVSHNNKNETVFDPRFEDSSSFKFDVVTQDSYLNEAIANETDTVKKEKLQKQRRNLLKR